MFNNVSLVKPLNPSDIVFKDRHLEKLKLAKAERLVKRMEEPLRSLQEVKYKPCNVLNLWTPMRNLSKFSQFENDNSRIDIIFKYSQEIDPKKLPLEMAKHRKLWRFSKEFLKNFPMKWFVTLIESTCWAEK
jgi:hypothetical protein